MNGFVYLWENKRNGKIYIGSHKGTPDDSYIGSGVYFTRAYKKEPNNFKRTILYIGKEYRQQEESFLKLFDAANNNKFYNLKNEAIGGWEHCNTDEIKNKRNKALSKAKKGKYPNWLRYDKSGENNPMYGKRHTEETKLKLSKIRKNLPPNRICSVIEKTSGMIFNSITECANYYNVTQPTMSVLIRNKVITRGKCKNKIFDYA